SHSSRVVVRLRPGIVRHKTHSSLSCPCECYGAKKGQARRTRSPFAFDRLGLTFTNPFFDYPRKASVGVANLERFGKTVARSLIASPYQVARVAAYWSTDVVG